LNLRLAKEKLIVSRDLKLEPKLELHLNIELDLEPELNNNSNSKNSTKLRLNLLLAKETSFVVPGEFEFDFKINIEFNPKLFLANKK